MKLLISTIPNYSHVASLAIKSIHKANLGLKVRVVSHGNSLALKKISEYIEIQKDFGWSKNILIGINDLKNSDYIILTMDDLVVKSSPPAEIFKATIDYFIKKEYDAVNLYSPPSDRFSQSIRGDFAWASFFKNNKYPISCMFTLFNVGFLRKMLDINQNAWQFENSAKDKIARLEAEPKIMSLGFNLVNLSNLVIRGKNVSWRNNNKKLKGIKNMGLVDKIKHILKIYSALIYRFEYKKFVKFMVN